MTLASVFSGHIGERPEGQTHSVYPCPTPWLSLTNEPSRNAMFIRWTDSERTVVTEVVGMKTADAERPLHSTTMPVSIIELARQRRVDTADWWRHSDVTARQVPDMRRAADTAPPSSVLLLIRARPPERRSVVIWEASNRDVTPLRVGFAAATARCAGPPRRRAGSIGQRRGQRLEGPAALAISENGDPPRRPYPADGRAGKPIEIS